MAFDFKKEYPEFYLPPRKPELITVPEMNYIAVRGQGDPNQPDGAYQQALGILYGMAYTLKMSYMGSYQIQGYYPYVVPPLEGFWRQEGKEGFDYADKSSFQWIAVIRLPEFVTQADFAWAAAEAERKKKLDCSPAEFWTVEEGLCVQMMHVGPYDAEPATVAEMDRYISEQGYRNDMTAERLHHEIYLSDPRRTAPEKLKTVIRHPVKKAEEKE